MAMRADKEMVIQAMARLLSQPVEKLADDQVLTELVAESFALVEMVIQLQEEFGVHFGQEELKGVRTVGDLASLVSTLTKSKS